MSKLEELARAIGDELKGHLAELTATKTQLDALRQAHDQTLEQVTQSHSDLATAQGAINEARASAKRITDEAQERAGQIMAEADKMNREAGATLHAAQEQAKEIILHAEEQAKAMDRALDTKRAEVKAAELELNKVKSDHASIVSRIRETIGI